MISLLAVLYAVSKYGGAALAVFCLAAVIMGARE